MSETQTQCEYCRSHDFVNSRGEIICAQCGTIFERVYVQSTYSISETDTHKPSQYTDVGKRLDRINNLGSEIGYYRRMRSSVNAPKVATSDSKLNTKLYRLNKSSMTQTHIRTLSIFNRISAQLQITPSLKSRSLYLYWKYVGKLQKKKSHLPLIALCLLYAVRESKSPYKFSEIINSFKSNGHRVTNRNVLSLAMDLNINLSKANVRKSEDYIERITEKIAADDRVQKKLHMYDNMTPSRYRMLLMRVSYHLLSTLDTERRRGEQPFGFAVTIVYLADRGIRKFFRKSSLLTQRLTAEITGAKEFTIRDHFYKKRMMNHLENQFDKVSEIIRKFNPQLADGIEVIG